MIKILKENEPPLKPKIDEKSKALAKNVPDIITRNKEAITAKKSPPKTATVNPKKGFTANPISDDYYKKTVKQFLDTKESKLKTLRKQQSAKEIEGFTGKPEINKKHQVNSKIGIGLQTSEYISIS